MTAAGTQPHGPRDGALLIVARVVTRSAAVFLLIICALIIANAIQTHRAQPLTSPELDALRMVLRNDPGNDALREQIRALDLLTRRAYFSSVDFARGGAWLLLGGLTVLLAAAGLARTLKARAPDPDAVSDPDVFLWNRRGQRVLAVSGAALLAACLALSLRTPRVDYAAAIDADGTVVATAPPAFASMDAMRRNWPSFRGPDGNGVAMVANAPMSWDGSAGQGVVWKAAVPLPGFSSPIVWSNRVVVTGGNADVREVFAFDADTGALAWRHAALGVPGAPEQAPAVTPDTGYAAPTPATDGRHVFAIFATGDLVALDFDGVRLWAKNVGVPKNHYGHSSSLITWQDRLLVQFDHADAASLRAFDGATGNELWQVERTDIAWGSPICVNTGTRDEVILTCSTGVASYDPLTGRLLWSEACMAAEVGTSAAYANGMVFVGNAYTLGSALRIAPPPAEPPVTIAWQTYDYLPEAASPLATTQGVYFATSDGTIACLDPATGALRWSKDFDAGFYASPVLAAGRVYALDREGVMHVFDDASVYTERATSPLGEPAAATPAFVGDRIYLRGEEHLYCVRSHD